MNQACPARSLESSGKDRHVAARLGEITYLRVQHPQVIEKRKQRLGVKCLEPGCPVGGWVLGGSSYPDSPSSAPPITRRS